MVQQKKPADSSVSVGSGNVHHIGESGVIGRLVTAVSSIARAALTSVKKVATAAIQSSSKGANDSRANVIVAGTDPHSVSCGVAKVTVPCPASSIGVEMHSSVEEVAPAICNDSSSGMESSVNQATLDQGPAKVNEATLHQASGVMCDMPSTNNTDPARKRKRREAIIMILPGKRKKEKIEKKILFVK